MMKIKINSMILHDTKDSEIFNIGTANDHYGYTGRADDGELLFLQPQFNNINMQVATKKYHTGIYGSLNSASVKEELFKFVIKIEEI